MNSVHLACAVHSRTRGHCSKLQSFAAIGLLSTYVVHRAYPSGLPRASRLRLEEHPAFPGADVEPSERPSKACLQSALRWLS